MSALDAAVGKAPPLTIKTKQGETKTYEARLIDLDMESDFSHWLMDQSKAVLREIKDDLGEEMYKAQLLLVAGDYLAGRFGLMGEAGQNAIKTMAGGSKLVGMILGLSPADAFALIRDHHVEVMAYVETIKALSYGQAKKEPEKDQGPETPGPNA